MKIRDGPAAVVEDALHVHTTVLNYCSEDSIKKFGWNIQKLIEKKDLSRQQSYDMFRQVLLNAQPDLQQGAFLAGRFGIRNPADPKLGLTTANDYTQYINKMREFHA